MALSALQRRVCTGQREARCRVIEGSISPICGRVALVAGLWEPSLDVVRIRRALEIF